MPRSIAIEDLDPDVDQAFERALRKLGEAVGRPGALFDVMAARAVDGKLPAPVILDVLLQALGPIWPGRLSLGGVPLGDCWRHPAIKRGDATNGLVPIHKLSQWLAYSLIEPLLWAGIEVTDIDGLTGLAEYRNGGLFIDAGVLSLRDPAGLQREHTVDSELVVEWRALTVALLDRLADVVRARLKMDRQALPLARILQGGTWTAGRNIAKKMRPDGGPGLRRGGRGGGRGGHRDRQWRHAAGVHERWAIILSFAGATLARGATIGAHAIRSQQLDADPGLHRVGRDARMARDPAPDVARERAQHAGAHPVDQ